jgi:thymidylate synthase
MEQQYLNLIKTILENGETRPDRTGVGTRSVFGAQLRCCLATEGFPLLTTKRVFFRGVVEELLWFLRGQTDSKILETKGVAIWKGNTTREFLDARGLTELEEGDAGTNYSFQWRHFNASYKGSDKDYTGQGVDQIAWLLHEIKTNPSSRRLVLSAWNPCQLEQTVLPPCHVLCQFYVSIDKKLSCHMYQRSCDVALGLPFNMASYALLTHLIALECGLEVGDLIISLGDAHIYLNHIEGVTEQLTRTPREFPKLAIKDHRPLEGYEFSDFTLVNYTPYATIKMEMAV